MTACSVVTASNRRRHRRRRSRRAGRSAARDESSSASVRPTSWRLLRRGQRHGVGRGAGCGDGAEQPGAVAGQLGRQLRGASCGLTQRGDDVLRGRAASPARALVVGVSSSSSVASPVDPGDLVRQRSRMRPTARTRRRSARAACGGSAVAAASRPTGCRCGPGRAARRGRRSRAVAATSARGGGDTQRRQGRRSEQHASPADDGKGARHSTILPLPISALCIRWARPRDCGSPVVHWRIVGPVGQFKMRSSPWHRILSCGLRDCPRRSR